MSNMKSFPYCDSFGFYLSSLQYPHFMQGHKKPQWNHLQLTSLVCPMAMMKSKKGSSPPCWAGEFSWTCKTYILFLLHIDL